MIGTPLWQTSSWNTFQNKRGIKTLSISLSQEKVIYIQFFSYFKFFKRALISRGPHLAREFTEKEWEKISKICKKNGAAFVLIEPEQECSPPFFYQAPSWMSHQPQSTQIIMLNNPIETLLSQMKRKGRYNIKVAQKNNLKTLFLKGEESIKYLEQFYELLTETHSRDGFSIHNKEYYKHFLLTVNNAYLGLVFSQEKVVSAGIFVFSKTRALYYYGSSSYQHRNLMGPYLLQWSAILKAKADKAEVYDFLGIAPENCPNNHPWKGITRFKQQFGGIRYNYPNPKLMVFSPTAYWLYRVGKFASRITKSVF